MLHNGASLNTLKNVF